MSEKPVRNPFRDKVMRSQFDALVKCYDERHRDLITASGRRHLGNTAATHFWRGYDGVLRHTWDAGSRKLIVWACYRAGEAVRKREDAARRPLIEK